MAAAAIARNAGGHPLASLVMGVLLAGSIVASNGFLVPHQATTIIPSVVAPTKLSPLHMASEHDEDFWTKRWEAADQLEIRLDVTLVSCHCLARFLTYDMTLPPKATPAMEVTDVISVIDTFTSALILATLWTAAGLVTRLFEDTTNWSRLLQTTALAAPLWLCLELVLGWPAAGSGWTERIILGALGLLATMSLGRLVPTFLR